MEKCANMDSSDDDDDEDFAKDEDEHEDDPKNSMDNKTKAHKFASPVTLYRCVTRLNGRHSLAKMNSNREIMTKIGSIWDSDPGSVDVTEVVNDSDNETHDDDNDVQSPGLTNQVEEQQSVEDALEDIRQKKVEYDRKRVKGVQFTNAGDGNLKVVNGYAMTSSTCTLT